MRQKKKFELTLAPVNVEQKRNTYSTRMHSSRMRTASVAPEQGPPPRPDPPQLPPWVRAWTRSPLTSPLGVGLDQINLNFPLGVGLDQIPLSFILGCGPGDPPPTARSP